MTSLEGVAQSIKAEVERSDHVVRFLLNTDDGEDVPVEMRGEEKRGWLEAGNRVVLVANKKLIDEDGIARPTRIQNLTVKSTFSLTPRKKSMNLRGRVIIGAVGSLMAAALGGVSKELAVAIMLELAPRRIGPFDIARRQGINPKLSSDDLITVYLTEVAAARTVGNIIGIAVTLAGLAVVLAYVFGIFDARFARSSRTDTPNKVSSGSPPSQST